MPRTSKREPRPSMYHGPWFHCDACRKLRPRKASKHLPWGWRCYWCKNRPAPGRVGPRSVVVQIIDGIPTHVKRCNGPTCHGLMLPVNEFFKLKQPPTQGVHPTTVGKPTRYQYYSSQCKRCCAFRHRKRYKTGAWTGNFGTLPVVRAQRWVDELMNRCGNSPKTVADLTGVNSCTIYDIRMGKSKRVRKETAARLLAGLREARKPAFKPQLTKYSGARKLSARQVRLRAADYIDAHEEEEEAA